MLSFVVEKIEMFFGVNSWGHFFIAIRVLKKVDMRESKDES